MYCLAIGSQIVAMDYCYRLRDKRLWAPGSGETRYLEAYRSSVAARTYRLRRVWLPRLKRRVVRSQGGEAPDGAEGAARA